MNKMFLFIITVFIGLIILVIISNLNSPAQKVKSSKNPKSPVSQSNNPSIHISAPTTSSTISPKNTQRQNTAVIKTSKGDITLTLYANEAPKTVANFINKAKSGFYNNLIFHRVEDWVIQGGDPIGNGTGGGKIPTELNDKSFIIGSLGVARGPDINVSNDAQFFITKKAASWLNKQYANFGIVSNGIDVVNKIEIGDKILQITIQ